MKSDALPLPEKGAVLSLSKGGVKFTFHLLLYSKHFRRVPAGGLGDFNAP